VYGPAVRALADLYLASLIVRASQGSFIAGFFMENGDGFKMFNVSQGMAAVFPQGAIHFEQNINCEPAVFVAGFNSEDPGVSTIATNFFGLPTQVLFPSVSAVAVAAFDIRPFRHRRSWAPLWAGST
jgi:hypothetical protein